MSRVGVGSGSADNSKREEARLDNVFDCWNLYSRLHKLDRGQGIDVVVKDSIIDVHQRQGLLSGDYCPRKNLVIGRQNWPEEVE